MRTVLTDGLENFIRPEAILLLTPEELVSFKSWLKYFQKSNRENTDESMLCIPPRGKVLEAAMARITSKLIEEDMRKLSFDAGYKKSPRPAIWSDFLNL